MSENDVIFSKSIVTRVSHDLAGVISAVSNSLALLDELGGADRETLELAMNNADILMGRLRFFRAAFGSEGPLTDLGVTQHIFEEYLSTLENRVVRYACVWQTDRELPIFTFRLILLGGMIAADSLPRGGRLLIRAEAGTRRICFETEGKGASVDPSVSAAMTQADPEQISPRTMPVFFLQNCLSEQGWELSVSSENDKVVFVLNEKEK